VKHGHVATHAAVRGSQQRRTSHVAIPPSAAPTTTAASAPKEPLRRSHASAKVTAVTTAASAAMGPAPWRPGDIAITFMASGGVTLAGGILPRIASMIDKGAFRQAFEAKEPVDGLTRRIATRLLMEPDAVLYGMAAIAGEPDRYAVDYKARAWQ
jgi:glucokinase